MSQIPPLSFPYPEGKVPARPSGQGCVACVHKRYCGAFYWHIRFIEREMPQEYGLSCPKWSNNKADMIDGRAEGDIYQVEKMMIDGTAAEPNQNGTEESIV